MPSNGSRPLDTWGSGDSWHAFHVTIFHIFSVLIKLNGTARVGENILGLQSDATKKEK